MKISNSKKELAKIIRDNGGWRDGGEWAAQDGAGCDGLYNVAAYGKKPVYEKAKAWHKPSDYLAYHEDWFKVSSSVNGWHQTILSRAEYFHLHPAPDADGWIEWNGEGADPVEFGVLVDVKLANGEVLNRISANSGAEWRHCWGDTNIIAYRLHNPEKAKSTAVGDDETNLESKEELEAMELRESAEVRANLAKIYAPSIESLAADYRNKLGYAGLKQDEADKAKAESGAALSELEKAIAAIGFAITPICADAKEPEFVITDWRDLQIGDEVECLLVNINGDDYGEHLIGCVGRVLSTEEPGESCQAVEVEFASGDVYWISEWRFIRRPAK